MNSLNPDGFVSEGPTPLLRDVPAAAPFPTQALGPLKEAAEAAHDITQAPPALAAQSALAVAALAAQAHYNVETLGGPKPVSLFALSVAESGERKSGCDRLLMRAVHDYGRELTDAYREDIESFKSKTALWQARHKDILKKPNAEGTEADLAALGPEPSPPILPMVTATDPTVEGITRNLGQCRPSLGIFSDEGGQFIGGSGMSDDNRLKTVATLSSFWDGSPINRARAGDGAVTHYGKRLSAHLMVQPVAAAKLLSDPITNGQGFLARFLITEPESTMGLRLHRDATFESMSAIDAFADRIGEMLRQEPVMREGTRNELEPVTMALSAEAKALLVDFADAVEKDLPTGRALESVRPFAAKAAEHAARIAGALTAYSGLSSVDGETMANAIALARYYLGEAVRLADAALISAETAKLERMRKWLVESWPEDFISPTDARQWGPFRETSACKKLMAELSKFGWLSAVEGGALVKGKTRREAFRVVRG